jgi:aldehyde dehydrogenase (NAD+)
MERLLLYIAGQWVEPQSARWIDNLNPANTDDRIGQVSAADVADVEQAVAAASAAFPAWHALPAPKRGEILYRAAHILEARAEQVARDLTREMGKPLPEAQAEVGRGPMILRYFAGETSQPHGETYPSNVANRWLFTRHEPLGVIGLITPWNFPFAIPLWKLVPALAYGNTVVLKAAELTPLSAWHIAAVLHEAGLPPGVFNLVTGKGRVIGEALVRHPHIAAISFTGSNAVGRHIQALAVERGAKVQLEMGGKNPVVVTARADLDLAVEMVTRGAMRCAGQKCTATSRVLVEKPVYTPFVTALVERIKTLKVGDGMHPDTYVGPVVSQAALDGIAEYLRIGREEAELAAGGSVLTEGDYGRGYYVEPTVFVDAPLEGRLMQEEIFGPVVGVAPVADLDEAIAAANGVQYGFHHFQRYGRNHAFC